MRGERVAPWLLVTTLPDPRDPSKWLRKLPLRPQMMPDPSHPLASQQGLNAPPIRYHCLLLGE